MYSTRTQYYLPADWDDFIGNEKCVKHFQNIVRLVRVERKIPDASTLLIGPPGCGKTALARKLGQCLLCENLDLKTLNNCRRCKSCEDLAYIEGNDNIETRLMIEDASVQNIFSPIGCVGIKASDLKERLGELQTSPGIVRLAHLEEVGCLAEEGIDLELNIPMDDRGFIWIGTGMTYKGLSDSFLRRFTVKLRVSLPDKETLALWLTKRAIENGVGCQDFDTMVRLAERSNCRPGYGLLVVKYASSFSSDEAIISQELVEDFIFDFDE